MSDRVERHILGLIADRERSPYGNPIPGLEELDAVSFSGPAGGRPLTEVAGPAGRQVRLVRIGEPAQVEPEVLDLLLSTGLTPGAQITVRTEGERIVAEGAGGQAVSLPQDVALHVFVTEDGDAG